jgi:hypothetical protein
VFDCRRAGLSLTSLKGNVHPLRNFIDQVPTGRHPDIDPSTRTNHKGSFLLEHALPALKSGSLSDSHKPGSYGSLIWNPTVDYVERRVAKVLGWRRSFCLATPAGRGSVDNPGLVLGLDAGGDCTDVAFRIAGHVAEAELATLWKREMLAASYIPRWLDCMTSRGVGSAVVLRSRSIREGKITPEI